jgi:HTH-type transcriptional regulator / antitoxin HigA
LSGHGCVKIKLRKIASLYCFIFYYGLQMIVPLPLDDFRMPGQLVQHLLDQKGWNKRVLAIVLRLDETVVNKLISGRRRMDAGTAIRLAELFDIKPDTLLDLQKTYDLAKAKIIARPDPGMATRATLFGDLPVSEMIKRGWIDAKDVRDVGSVEVGLSRFFGVQSVDEIEILPHAARKTNVTEPVTPAQLAWIYRVQEIASELLVHRYDGSAVADCVPLLKNLLIAPEAARKVPAILAEAGVRFVLVESLASAKIDGVCFWLDDRSPVIGMSLRFDRIDNFWFVLRHEIEHVLRLHGRDAIALDAELEGDRAGTGDALPEEERIANDAAANFCVPSGLMERFIARKDPFFAERDILGFAKTLEIHPGIVAGQLQRRTGRYDRFRDHLVKIRHCVAPSAFVDGWGDVFPLGE